MSYVDNFASGNATSENTYLSVWGLGLLELYGKNNN